MDALEYHRKYRGKIELMGKSPLFNKEDLALAYTPGVAEVSLSIVSDPENLDLYTSRWNTIAIVSDGSAVLGLGCIGPEAALPVMEGKAVLFKLFGGVDAFPLCLNAMDPEKLVEHVAAMEPSFGGINLEDITAPKCFTVERMLKERMNVPIFHDDQHGTAVVVLAGLINSAKLRNAGDLESWKFVINGAGAAGIAIAKMLLSFGCREIILCDRTGTVFEGRKEGMNASKEDIALTTNRSLIKGTLSDALSKADCFIGVSAPGVLNGEMVSSMADKPVIFALGNPDPEINPDEAKAAGAFIIATGRSDYPNQVNNLLGFPGIFRGALDVRARDISENMKLAASKALAGLITENDLERETIIPSPLDLSVAPSVAGAVAEAAVAEGTARVKKRGEVVAFEAKQMLEKIHAEYKNRMAEEV